MPTTPQRRQTLRQGLEDLGFDSPESFADCESRQAEFSLLKKHYHRLCRQHHPDKGGDPAQFRRIHTSYELLRDLHAGEHEELQRRPWPARWRFVDAWATTRRKSTTDDDDNSPAQAETTFDMSAYDFNFANMETPSWEYYQDAAAEDVPPYRIELAKTGRSKCTEMGKKAKKCALGVVTNNHNNADGTTTTALIDPTRAPEYIEQGEVRVGWLSEFGMYHGWKHLRCWRVPYKVWQGLPDPNHCQDAHKFHQALVTMTEVVITGYDELPATDQQAVVAHCMDRGNWAAYRKPKAEKEAETTAAQQQETTTSDTTETVPTASVTAKLPLAVPSSSLVPRASTALVQGRVKFATPVPGVNGASDATVFQFVRFVLTGLFPEIGGGQGLLLGKDRVKAMITAFGGRVTGSISGKTNVLVVGKEPGMSKVTQARARAAMKMCSLKDLKEGLDAGATCLEDFDFYHRKEPMMIQNFSMGYKLKSGYNGLAIAASQKDLAIAHGFAARAQANDTPKSPPPPPPAGTTSSSPVVLTIDDDDDDDGDKKPAAQSPRTNAKRKALLAIANASGDEFPSESPAKAAKSSVETTTTTTTTTNNQESKMPPYADDDDKEDVIVCDQCSEDCTAESWFLAKSEKDFCVACYGKQSARLRKVMEHQRDGQAVVKSS